MYAESGFYDPNKPIRDFTKQELDDFLYKDGTKVRINGINLTYEGLVSKVQKSMLSKDVEALQPHIRAFVDRAVTFSTCPACGGTRLNEAARSSKIDGVSIADACAMQISDLAAWVRGLAEPSVGPLLETLRESLDSFVEMGLGYLSLDRPSGTLSGGEAQRTRMIRHLGSSLTDVTYVFDEPTIGLHAHDVERMNSLLRRLRDKGNTVLVVEHEAEVIRIADRVVDMGPGAGPHGGTVVYEGTVDGLVASGTATGSHLDTRQELKADATRGRVAPSRFATPGCTTSGTCRSMCRSASSSRSPASPGPARALDPRLPAAHGPVGDGHRPVRDPGLAPLEPGDLHRHPRPNPDGVREGERGQAGALQRELRGRLPELQRPRQDVHEPRVHGGGRQRLRGLRGPPVHRRRARVPAAGPEHRRGARDAGRGGPRVLHREAGPRHARSLADVGLGYISLGQELDTLSGGERQRLKLAIEMSSDTEVYVLDEPTTGLHMQDVENLIGLLERLVDSGRTVIVIEHNLDVVARADWVIDLGPGAGHDGGTIVFEGPPAALVRADGSLTGEHLARRTGGAEVGARA